MSRPITPRYPSQERVIIGVTDDNGAFYKGVLVGAGGLVALSMFLYSMRQAR